MARGKKPAEMPADSEETGETSANDAPDRIDVAGMVVVRDIGGLIPYARNSRTHSDDQIRQLMGSIVEFGFTNPILADENGIVAGHGRVMAATRLYKAGKSIKLPGGKVLPAGTVPVIDCTGWTDGQRRAYVIADNKLALNAGWDDEMLASELADLTELGFDMDVLGFSDEELAEVGANLEWDGEQEKKESILDKIQVTIDEPRNVVVKHDRWLLGEKHILICANIISGWPEWIGELQGDETLFVPYAGIYAALAEKANNYRLVIVQPDTYVAGHVLDRYEDIHGPGSIVKVSKDA